MKFKINLKIFFIVFALIALVLSIVYFQLLVNNQTQNKIVLNFEKLEIADEINEQEIGLMNRESLCENCGMLFVYPNETQLTFWMKNTFISLDIIYLNKDFKVVNIAKNTKTNQMSELYPSILPAQYVLEVNSGFSQRKNIQNNTILQIENFTK
jgi:uncharacterized protein